MSVKLLSKAFEMPLKPNEKLVLLALADCANDDGYAFPGYKKLIQKTSLARATLAKNLKILEMAGLFDKEGHATIGVGKSVNTYQLKLDFDESELKKSLENARKSISKSSTVELDELGRKVQTVNRKVQTVKSSPDEPRKVQTVNSKSSTVEHEPSVLTVSNEPSVKEAASAFWKTKKEDEQKQAICYENLQADYRQSDIDEYVERYNDWVISSGKSAKIPALAIRRWMVNSKIAKKLTQSEIMVGQIAKEANFPRWDWETDESYLAKVDRWISEGLNKLHDPTTRTWATEQAKAKATEIAIEVKREFGYA